MRAVKLYTFLLLVLFVIQILCLHYLSIFLACFCTLYFLTPWRSFIKCIYMFWTNKGIIIIKCLCSHILCRSSIGSSKHGYDLT